MTPNSLPTDDSTEEEIPTKRRYQELWEKVVARAQVGDFRPVNIRIPGLKDSWFHTVRKAFWKEKDLDTANKGNWRAKVERGDINNPERSNPDVIYFSVIPKNIKDRI